MYLLNLLFDVSGHYLFLLLPVLLVLFFASQRYQKGLNKYPGPFLASITNNWRLVDVWKRDTHITFRKLHQQYGGVVRVAPNVLSFADPRAIPDIYGLNKGYIKVRFMQLPARLHWSHSHE